MIFGFIMGLCALMMISIGVVQLRSKKPVGFYTGEKPLKPEQVSDVSAWNRKHGIMWILYGFTIIVCWFVGLIMGDTLWFLIPFCSGILLPIFIMIWYHERLKRKYIL